MDRHHAKQAHLLLPHYLSLQIMVGTSCCGYRNSLFNSVVYTATEYIIVFHMPLTAEYTAVAPLTPDFLVDN